MKLRILGCSGGIGGNHRTTSMLIDEDILIDAGTGVGDLSISELAKIDHVFLTHSHLDHVTSIPFILDTVGWTRDEALTIHALPQTIEVLQQHLFNWKLWPDFAQIPDPEHPYLCYSSIDIGKTEIIGGRKITPLPANHVVPAVGFQIDSGDASLVYSGDTTTNDALWSAVNQIENLRYLIIETAFCNREKDLAIASKHLCPSLLVAELQKLQKHIEIFITHLKPGEVEATMREIHDCAGRWNPRMLETNMIFQL